MNVTAFSLAQRFVGMKEVPGTASNPAVLAMLRLDQPWPTSDEVPWCSAFANYIAWLLRLPRSHNLSARSWLNVGESIEADQATVGFDVVILSRGTDPTAGHVGFFAGAVGGVVNVLGGNQGDSVSVESFMRTRILGVRRLFKEG